MNKAPIIKTTIIPTSGRQAFAAIEAEIAAVRDDALIKISVDIPFAHQIAHAAADRIDELMPQLVNLPYFDLDRVLKIRVYAAACQHAHLLATSPEVTDPKLVALLEEGTKLREDMLVTAELLAHFGEVNKERVAAIRTGVGYIDMANDIEQLGVLFHEVWEKVKGRVPVTLAMLERAPQLAYQLHVALGVKRVGSSLAHDPQRTRQRAYTLFVAAYRECQRGVDYLRSPTGDADHYAPSIYAKQKRRVTSQNETDVDEDVDNDVEEDDETTEVITPPAIPVMTELEPTG